MSVGSGITELILIFAVLLLVAGTAGAAVLLWRLFRYVSRPPADEELLMEARLGAADQQDQLHALAEKVEFIEALLEKRSQQGRTR